MLHPTRILERRVADPDENSCASPDCWSPLFRLPCSATENGR
jgi:hypothetical protein